LIRALPITQRRREYIANPTTLLEITYNLTIEN
jgi:hypothetical protein